MKINDKLYGFTVTDVSDIGSIGAVMYLMEHDGTGAKLCFLKREDQSRTFAITFGTPPTDDTGVFHILEHSVLCGSRKFPTKEPFTELLKSSLNTFLNAMTYPDMTSYPVASRNDKDFYNLVDVYLDAVFNPLATEDERIFKQEGWRIEATPEGGVQFNGVVYSEMRGVYSSADSIAAYHNARLLYPGGTYAYDSGGHPSAITDLTHAEFAAAHKKHYHPSGAYIFLDGEPKLDEILPLISSYLDGYTRKEVSFDIVKGGEVITEPMYEKYEIDEGEDPKNKTRVYLSYRSSDFSDIIANAALSVITDAVADSNEAPLKGAILASGLCENVYIYNSPGCKWGSFNIEFRGVRDGSERELIAHFDKCIAELLASGIDRELIKASTDRIEFKTREADYGSSPKGIVYLSAINDLWLYGEHPKKALDSDTTFKRLRELIPSSYYEELVRSIITSPRATLILTPSKQLSAERERETEQKLAAMLGILDDERLTKIAEDTVDFVEWQAREDTPEALATIPKLSIADLGDEPKNTPTIIDKYDGSELICHPISTNGISYIKMYFDASDADAEEVSALGLLSLLYSHFDTLGGSVTDFRRRAKSALGDISMTTSVIKRGEDVLHYLVLSFSFLDSKRDEALLLAREHLYDVIFENREVWRRALKQYTANMAETIAEQGHSYAIKRNAAKSSRAEAVREYSLGYEFYRFMKSHRDDSDEELDLLISRLRALAEKILVRERLTVSLTGKEDKELLRRAADMTKHGQPSRPSAIATLPRVNEGIIIPSQVSYAVLGGNLNDIGCTHRDGAFVTLATILNYEVLWEEVRVKGGAYGTGFITRSNSGTMAFYSYRDPAPKASINTFARVPDFIREMKLEPEILEGYIIGSVGEIDTISTPSMEGNTATKLYLSGIPQEDILKMRRECIGTTEEKLKELADIIGKVIDESCCTVVGPREKLREIELDRLLEL